MKFISRLSAAVAVMATLGLTACESDDNGGNGGVETNNPNSGETPTTPLEEKQYIENTAKQLQTALNPQDQADFLNFCKDFAQEFAGFIGADDFDPPYGYMVRGVSNLGKTLRNSDLIGMTRAIQELSYSFADIAGIYEPDFEEEEWVKKGNSTNLEYRFNVNGQNCSLTVVPSGGEWSASAPGWIEDDEYPYDEHEVNIKIAVPRNVTVTLTQGSKTLLSGKVVNDFNKDGKTANCNVDATLANINLKADANLTNTKLEAHATATVGGTQIMETNGVLNGHDMCDFDRLMKIAAADEDNIPDTDEEAWITSPYNIHSLFTNGTANVNMMRRIFIAGNCDDMARLSFTFSNFEEENEAKAKQQVEYINQHINAKYYLGGAEQPTGDIFWQLSKEIDDWGGSYNYTYYFAEPVMKFNSDGSVYKFQDYFNEEEFASTLEVFESIAELYKAFFGLNQ